MLFPLLKSEQFHKNTFKTLELESGKIDSSYNALTPSCGQYHDSSVTQESS